MSYPVVTRLGVNQFWYRHWYTDTLYNQSCHQDLIFEKFVMLYVDYGTNFNQSMFIHEYWYTKPSKAIRLSPLKTYMKYYRKYYYSNTTLGIEHSFLIRNHSGEYFPMRCWILKYNNWIIISLKFFKPLKLKYTTDKSTSLKTSLSSVATSFKYDNSHKLRLKLFYSYFFKRLSNISNDYTF